MFAWLVLTPNISVIRSSFQSDSHSCLMNLLDTRKVLQSLTSVTNDDVRCLVLLVPCKSSEVDPILAMLVGDCICILITLITSIMNLSLAEGSFPLHFKSALVSPLLKKNTLIKDRMKYYRQCLILTSFPRFLRKSW